MRNAKQCGQFIFCFVKYNTIQYLRPRKKGVLYRSRFKGNRLKIIAVTENIGQYFVTIHQWDA